MTAILAIMCGMTPPTFRDRLAQLQEIVSKIDKIRDTALALPVSDMTDIAHELSRVVDELHNAVTFSELSPQDFRNPDNDPLPEEEAPEARENTRALMIEFFMSRKNKPASTKDIVTATGATKGGVTSILYKRNSGYFEGVGSVASGAAPQKLWRLTEKGQRTYFTEMDDAPRVA
jgi:hypothetical protein